MHAAQRVPGLDVLRGLAIVWVMLFHSWVVGGLGPDWSWLSRYGWMGVDLFFVLSGYLIGLQVLLPLARGGPLPLGDFYLRRALRILPAYLATLALYQLWPDFREAPGLEPWWKFLTFSLNLNIDYDHRSAFSHAWSLCVEEHFYWLFPALALGLRRRFAARAWLWTGAAVVLGGIALRSGVWWRGMAADPAMTHNWFVEDLYYPTWNRLDGLLCGVALAAWRAFKPLSWQAARRHAAVSALAGLGALACAFWLFRDRTGLLGNSVGWPVLSLACGLLVFAAAQPDSVVGRCRLPLAGFLAGISYSLYLVHKAAYHLVQVHWGDRLAGTGLLAFAAYGGAALLAGALMHRAVEAPFLRLRHRLHPKRS